VIRTRQYRLCCFGESDITGYVILVNRIYNTGNDLLVSRTREYGSCRFGDYENIGDPVVMLLTVRARCFGRSDNTGNAILVILIYNTDNFSNDSHIPSNAILVILTYYAGNAVLVILTILYR
jgi:hypothetical protein